MDCNKPGFPVFHYLPEFARTHVHWVNDAIQPQFTYNYKWYQLLKIAQ